MSTLSSAGVTTTSTAVATTAMSPSGTPVYVVRHQYGVVVHNQVTVNDSAGSHVVTSTGFTYSKPTA